MNALQDLLPDLAAALSRSGERAELVPLGDPLETALNPDFAVFGVRREVQHNQALTYFPPPAVEGVTEWRDHFNRDPNTFQPGELVAALVDTLVAPDGTVSWMVADASCSADRFTPVDLTEPQRAMLAQYVGTTAAIIVRIRQRTGRQWCHGSAYEVEPTAAIVMSPTNPTPDEIAQLPQDSHVVLEGTVVRYWEETVNEPIVPGIPTRWDRTYGYLELMTDDGQSYVVPSSRPHMRPLVYDKGVLENLQDQTIIPGERIRWSVYVGAEGYDGLHGRYSYPYLLVPNNRRLHAYRKLRAKVRTETRVMANYVSAGRYAKARAVFAALRRKHLTQDEQERIQAINAQMPVAERSIYDHRYEATSLLKIWGVDVESLNKAQFLEFGYKICPGEWERPAGLKSCDQSYIYRYMIHGREPFTKQETLALLRHSTWQRIHRLEASGDTHDEYWDHLYMMEQSVSYLCYVNLAAAIREILKVLEYGIKNEYYDKRARREDDSTCAHHLTDITYKAAGALRTALWQHPRLAKYVNRDRLMEIQLLLAPYPFAHIIAHELGEAVEKLDSILSGS
jgi:hypothetical protein